MRLRRVYVTILVFAFVYILAALTDRLRTKKAAVFTHQFRSTGSVDVTPDIIWLSLTKVEPLQSTAASALAATWNPVKTFAEQLSHLYTLKPVKVVGSTTLNNAGVALSFIGEAGVSVLIKDFAEVKPLIESALASGLNGVGVSVFELSPQLLMKSRQLANVGAHKKIMEQAEGFAAQVRLRLTKCEKPFRLGDGVAFESVAAGDWSGMGGFETTPNIVPLDSLIRPLSELVAPEVESKGSVVLAQTLIPKMVEISESVELFCEFEL